MEEVNQVLIKEKFGSMSDSSKVWIYQSNRTLSKEELQIIEQESLAFTQTWESHGSRLNAQFALLHDLFLVFVVNESVHEASGCSIDKSVHFVKELQSKLKIDFFDRTKIAVVGLNDQLELIPLFGIREALKAKEVAFKSLIFNNLIYNFKEFKQAWLVRADTTWLAKFLN